MKTKEYRLLKQRCCSFGIARGVYQIVHHSNANLTVILTLTLTLTISNPNHNPTVVNY